MAVITIAAINGGYWDRSDSDVELRVFALQPFISSDGTPVSQGTPSEDESVSNNNFVRVACTISGGQFVAIPSFVLFSTTDSDNPDACWGAFFYTTEGEKIGPFSEFASFKLPASPTETTWPQISAAQEGNL